MPLDDYRLQISARQATTLDMLAACADRYGVSLIAAALRWLEYTERRAVLVVSRDGYMLWSRSSRSALRSGAFFRTSKLREPVAIPVGSLVARQDMAFDNRAGAELAAGIWFNEPAKEMTVFSEQYDMVTTLLCLEDRDRHCWDEPDEDTDVFDRFQSRNG